MIRVLIVEDDPMVADFNRRYLEQIQGFHLVAIAGTAEEALAVLAAREIDLILLDIFMPGMNGLELLTTIREMGRSVDVIVVSAARDSRSIKTALRHGAVDYLIKPFEFERLRTALLSYKNWAKVTAEHEVLDQNDLDQRIMNKEQSQVTELPKGLDRNTLRMVWQSIQSVEEYFSTEELAKSVGISRVSVRKYIEFLTNLAVLHIEMEYGSVGRPTYRYRCINPDAAIMKCFSL